MTVLAPLLRLHSLPEANILSLDSHNGRNERLRADVTSSPLFKNLNGLYFADISCYTYVKNIIGEATLLCHVSEHMAARRQKMPRKKSSVNDK